MQAAIDLGISNYDLVYRRGAELEHTRVTNNLQAALDQTQAILQGLRDAGLEPERVAVTGGRYRSLPEQAGATRFVKIPEVASIGRGGLYLARLDEALVVSAGSGTAMIAARGRVTTHVTGSAVGGGTLQGLGHLLLGTSDAPEIDRLALQGDANRVDLTLVEAVGSRVGSLPLEANAVNFGRAGREAADFKPEDLAAGLVRLVGQVIAMIALNAARAERLEHIVVTGHLVDLPSVRKVLDETAGYYGARFCIPPRPGIGTAVGALICMEEAENPHSPDPLPQE